MNENTEQNAIPQQNTDTEESKKKQNQLKKEQKKKLKKEIKEQKKQKQKMISKKALERRVNLCKQFINGLETDDENIIQLRKLINVFLIREIDSSIDEKRKKGTDNAIWDKKIKDAKDEFMEFLNQN